jgi:DedD protein
MDKALKQRLVGATVLILAAIIVLPMLLSGQSETLQQETLRIEVPPKPAELSFESRRFPVGSQNNGSPSANQASEPGQDVPQTPPSEEVLPDPDSGLLDVTDVVDTPQAIVPAPVEESAPDTGVDDTVATNTPEPSAPVVSAVSPLAKPAMEPGGENESNKQRYLVQVASFSSTANANRLSGQLRDTGMPVLMDNVETDSGILHRVRVGPFDQRSEADDVVRMLRRQMSDLKPRVIDLKPEQGAPVTAPSDPMVRWIVQAGSFAEAQNADKLVTRLRQSGFSAYQEKVSDASSTVFKVRIGPEVKREAAVRIASRIKTELDIDGYVMSAD